MNRIKESQKNIAMVVSLLKPQVDPALYSVRQGLGMMNGNDNQMGQGSFAGCNGSQLRHVELIKEPNLLCDLQFWPRSRDRPRQNSSVRALVEESSHAAETAKCFNSFQIGHTRSLEIIESMKRRMAIRYHHRLT